MTSQINQLGKLPVIILPLDEYETMREDLEMLRSKRLAKSIKRARREVIEGKAYTAGEVKKMLKLS